MSISYAARDPRDGCGPRWTTRFIEQHLPTPDEDPAAAAHAGTLRGVLFTSHDSSKDEPT